jgi:hypothetical protein
MTVDNENLATVDMLLKQWQEITNQISAQVTPTIKIQEALQKSMTPIIEIQKIFQTFGTIIDEQSRWQKSIASIKIPVLDLSIFTKQISEFQKTLQGIISPSFEQFQQNFRKLPEQTQKALLCLGGYGWYTDLEMPDIFYLANALSLGKVTEVDYALTKYFDGQLNEIEQSIAEKFPSRAHLIKSAFNAHKEKKYELSIPVLLAQTDGICKEVADGYLFIKDRKNKKPGTARYVSEIAAGTIRSAILSPLAQTLPISMNPDERGEEFKGLNRHMVVHGESIDYGTKINGLKVISLINYVTQVLKI